MNTIHEKTWFVITPLKNPAPFFNNSNRNRPPRPWQRRIPNRSPPSPHTPPANAPVASYHISENHPQAFCVSRRIQGKQGTVRIDNKSLSKLPLISLPNRPTFTEFVAQTNPTPSAASVFNIPRPSTNQRGPIAKIPLNISENKRPLKHRRHLPSCCRIALTLDSCLQYSSLLKTI